MMLLDHIITLYRLAGRPQIISGCFSSNLVFTEENHTLITSIRSAPYQIFESLCVDDDEIPPHDQFPSKWNSISFSLRLPTNSDVRFYNSIDDLISLSNVSEGDLPEQFYIIDKDLDKNSAEKDHELKSLIKICILIKELSKLAIYHDKKSSNGDYNLVFIQPEGISSHPKVITTKIEKSLLNITKLDTKFIEDLNKNNLSTDIHHDAKVGIFYVTITSFFDNLQAGKREFTYLVENWEKFKTSYQQNFTTYLSGFAFHKVKQEIAEAELKLAEQFSRVISEIAGKLLSIPVSSVAIVIISKSDSIAESCLVVFSLLLAALLISGAIDNQQRQLERINHAKLVVFESFKGKEEEYPDVLNGAISDMKIGLNRNQENLQRTLSIFRGLSWAPVLVGSVFLIHQFLN